MAESVTFQSSPGLVTGRYQNSIFKLLFLGEFQSSPGLVTGRYRHSAPSTAAKHKFQSSPGLVTGRYQYLKREFPRSRCFNPRPVW